MGNKTELTSREKTALDIIEKWCVHSRMQSKRFTELGDKESAKEWRTRGIMADRILEEIKYEWHAN